MPQAKKQPSASDRVFWGIVRGLENQQFVTGQRLVEPELMARFGVGRNSVREALQRLAAEGVVDLSIHKGASIRILSSNEMFDLLEIVERLFSLATRTAAKAAADPEQQQALQYTLVGLKQADENRDSQAFAKARRSLYRILLDVGGNVDLKRMFTTLHIPLVYAQQHIPSLQRIRLVDYQRIVAAIVDNNPDEAEQAGALHVQNVKHALKASLSDNPSWLKQEASNFNNR